MLSDHERDSLLGIERWILAEDPDWVRAFHEVGQRFGRRYAFARIGYVVALVFSATLTVLMFVAHDAGVGLFFAGMAAGLVWLIRRRRRRAREPLGAPGRRSRS